MLPQAPQSIYVVITKDYVHEVEGNREFIAFESLDEAVEHAKEVNGAVYIYNRGPHVNLYDAK